MSYSVPDEARRVLVGGILQNHLFKKYLPAEATESSSQIEFIGSNEPSIPINWRFAESVSALKGYEATVLSILLQRKYGVPAPKIKINTSVSLSKS